MPRTTKKAEMAALAKERRKARRKNKAHQEAKRPGAKPKTKSRPHRKTSALRARH